MKEEKGETINVSRPGEYIAVFVMEANVVQEGRAYIFLACDAFSAYAYRLSVELDDSKATVLKAVKILLNDAHFKAVANAGFTLVFEHYEELAEEIEALVSPYNGEIIFNRPLNVQMTSPLRKAMQEIGNK